MGRTERVRSSGHEHPRTPLPGRSVFRHYRQPRPAQRQRARPTSAREMTRSTASIAIIRHAFEIVATVPYSETKALVEPLALRGSSAFLCSIAELTPLVSP